MKNFILRIGQPLIGVVVVIGIILSLFMAYGYASMPFMGSGSRFITFILTAVFGVSSIIIAAFLVYLLIDIRDELRKLAAK